MKHPKIKVFFAFATLLTASSAVAFSSPPSANVFELDAVDYISLGFTQTCSLDAEIVSRHNRTRSHKVHHALEYYLRPNGHDTCFEMIQEVCKMFRYHGEPLLLSFAPNGPEYKSDNGRMHQNGLVSKFICRHTND